MLVTSFKSFLSSYIIEGGAAGGLSHVYDEVDLTFAELKDIIKKALTGNLKATIKLDGQNLFVSWKNNKLIAARNKGNIRDFGAAALSVQGIAKKFAGRGAIETAFVQAGKDLQNAFRKVDVKFFKEGKKWINLEILHADTKNVIPYGTNKIVFHNVQTVNEVGESIDTDVDAARTFAEQIKNAGAAQQGTYLITGPVDVKLTQVPEYQKEASALTAELQKLMNAYKLSDKNTIKDYKHLYFANRLKKMGVEKDDRLIARLADGDKSYSLGEIKKNHPEQFEAIKVYDQQMLPEDLKAVIKPLDKIYSKVGLLVLRNLKDLTSADPDTAKQALKVELQNTIRKVGVSKDSRLKDKLKSELERLEALGGVESIVPEEGIVFPYNGKQLKLTGSFSSLNQLLGLLKYER